MACKIIKKLLGYELCIFEKEGTLYTLDRIVIIRKKGFTEISNLDTMQHETGDMITREVTRTAVYGYITDHLEDFI